MAEVVVERWERDSHVEERDLDGKRKEVAVEEKEWVDEERSLEIDCLIRDSFLIKRVMCIAYDH